MSDGESEVEVRARRVVEARREARDLRRAARRALALARLYRAEEGAAGGEREHRCVAQAVAWRRLAVDVARSAPTVPLPGPARAAPRVDAERLTRAG